MKPQSAPERGREQQTVVQPAERPEGFGVAQPERRPAPVSSEPEERTRRPAGPAPPGTPPPAVRRPDPLTEEVEAVLSEDLGDLYVQLPPAARQRFKDEGERAASRVALLLQQVRVKAQEVLTLIRDWLRLIPGVNRYFLEQEAKIKTDRIMALAKRKGIETVQLVLQVGLPSGGLGSPLASGGLANPVTLSSGVQIVLTVALGVVPIVAGLLIARLLTRRLNRLPRSLHYVVLRLTVPRESPDEAQRQPDSKAQLAVAETLFLNLGGIKEPRSGHWLRRAWEDFWFGPTRHLALEIVAQRGQIAFYAAVPRHLQRLVELQVHAQYPRAHIEEIEDYNIFTPRGTVAAATLKLTKAWMFPIRTYRKLDSDPLAAVLNALAKLRSDEGAAVQLLIRPAGDGWRRSGQRLAHQLQKGKSFDQAMAAVAGGGTGVLRGLGSALTSTLQSQSARELKEASLPPVLTPMQQELVKALEEKASKAGFQANLRLVVASARQADARSTLVNIANAFAQYTAQESGTGFRAVRIAAPRSFLSDFISRRFRERDRLLLNAEEVTSLYHLPLPGDQTPNLVWLTARTAPAPVGVPSAGVLLGVNRYRGVETPIHLKRGDRRRHVYLIGTTGSGKTNLMQEMAKQDIRAGEGVCVIDPHGGFVEDVLQSIPKERADDVVLFDPSDVERPLGLNMLEAARPEERDFAVQEMIAIFYKLFPPEMIGPMFEHNMRNAMLTLMEDEDYPGTIADIPRTFTDKAFQQYKVKKVRDPIVRAFWEKEMAKTSDFHKSEMLGYLVSKVGRFVENRMMRNIIGQPRSGFDFRRVMDEGQILLVNLSKGKVGEVNAALLGLIIVSKLQMAALARANVPEVERRDFFLYIDEFQNFITDSIATILSEARKYRLNLTMGHQYLGQLVQGADTKVRDAVLGNVGTVIAFRIGVEDADLLAKQFAPTFSAFDLVNQERFHAYVRLLVDNTALTPFSMLAHPPTPGDPAVARAVVDLSRLKHGRPQADVEAEILERTKLGEGAAASPPTPPPAAERLASA